ncbi:HAD-IIA family hydrolase [Cohnella nanjingensis]|uniref:HAD-IIA family hydrolase n=1 Tax=Cohnella nanjingensis TaxID=1387779 RepID=UPI0028B02F83|nr:HAD-IIA family hydrolase [Cohnella nanjingensis]
MENATLALRPDALSRPPKALLFDLDGTLYRGDELIPGADRLIADLEARGWPCWFLTNNSTRTPAQVAEHMHKLGIPARADRVITSAMAAAAYARERHPGAAAYVVGEHGLREALREAGLRLLDDPDSAEQAQIVVQGIDRNLTYDKLTEAVDHLLNGATYLVTNPDRLLPVGGGFLPGAGSIAALLETATGASPVVIGKPSGIIMDYALALAGVSAEEAWVVGDNPHTDLAAGLAAGCPTVLVLTGLCTAADWRERCAAAGAMPDAVCADPERLYAFITYDDPQG